MYLSELLKPEYVKIGLKGVKKEECLQEICEFISNVHGLDKKEVIKSIMEREKKGSTGLASGLAVPHGRSDNIQGIHFGVVYVPEGRDFEAYDKQPTYLFIAGIVSNQYSPHEQLEILKIIVEIYEKTDIKTSIKKVTTPKELYDLIILKEKEILK